MTRRDLGRALAATLLLGSCGGGSPTTGSSPAPSGPSDVVALDASSFDAVVTESGGVCLIDFFHPACSHCRNMEPIVEELATRFDGRAVVGKVDVTASPGLARAWEVGAYPTFVVTKDGRELARRLGEQSYDHLAAIVESALAG